MTIAFTLNWQIMENSKLESTQSISSEAISLNQTTITTTMRTVSKTSLFEVAVEIEVCVHCQERSRYARIQRLMDDQRLY